MPDTKVKGRDWKPIPNIFGRPEKDYIIVGGGSVAKNMTEYYE